MAKYIVDMDALFECCDFLSLGRLDGKQYTSVDNVRALLKRFPKDKVEETITVEVKKSVESDE